MAEPVKLYLDEDTISRALIRALRARGVDVLTAQEAEQMARSDREQLAYATSQGRTLFTFNTRDYWVKTQLSTLETHLLTAGHDAGKLVPHGKHQTSPPRQLCPGRYYPNGRRHPA